MASSKRSESPSPPKAIADMLSDGFNRWWGSILYLHTVPPVGGDTLFASQYAAYDALSPRMKTYLVIRAGKELSISTLGRAVALDRTSITRALAPLERDGLIRSRPGADKRIRIVSLTNKGRKLIEDAEPKWRQAQEALMQTIGEDRWRAMRTLLRDTTRMVRHRTITAE